MIMPEKLFNPDYLKHLCAKYGLTPSKKYGQNFLIDEEPIKKMIEAAAVWSNDTVVEIGPGFGVLTLALAARAKKVLAFEIEKKLEPYWNEIIENRKLENLEIIWGNVLHTHPFIPPPTAVMRGPAAAVVIGEGQGLPATPASGLAWRAGVGFKVVANLPYQITSEVIRKFLETKNKPEIMVLMVLIVQEQVKIQ